MKKRLFLLPLLAVGMLCGCGEEEAGGGNTPAPAPTPQPVDPTPGEHTHSWSTSWSHDETNHWKTCSGCSEKGSQAAHTFNGNTCSVCGYEKAADPVGGDVVLDFTDTSWKDNKVTPYINAEKDMGKLYTFTYQGITYNDIGCYASAGYQGAPNYLMMKNTGYGADKKQYATSYAFIGNQTAFTSPIKKVEVVIEGTNSSGNTIYRVNIGTSAATSAVSTGGETGKKGQTITVTSTDSNAYYFSISTNATSDNKIYNGQLVKVTVSF